MNDAHAAQIATVQEANSQTAAAAAVEEAPPKVTVKAAVAKKAERMAKEYAEKDKQYAANNIEWRTKEIQKELEKAAKALENQLEKAKLWGEAWTILATSGFKPREVDWQRWRIKVETTEKKLPKLAKLIGQLNMDEAEKEIEDAEKNTVRVKAFAKRYEFVQVTWTHKLTAKDRCKIVTETKTVTELVCEVDK